MDRICIYPKDIMIITGKGERRCRDIYNDIKVFYKKEKHQHISIQEFCSYSGLDIEEVKKLLR